MEKEIVTVNHWGKWVTSDVPVTGVMSVHNIAWEFMDDEQCLTCEAMYKEIEDMTDCPECEGRLTDDGTECSECGWYKENEYEFIECDSSHEKIFGDAWVLDTKTNKYDVAENKEGLEFAAILNESTVQVVWSKYIVEGKRLCSPCFPGQVDLDSEDGDFSSYTLPEYLIWKDEE